MSYRREVLKNNNCQKQSKHFLLPMIEVKLYHQSNTTNHLIDVCYLERGFPQIVLIFDNIDYEPLKMDIFKLQNNYSFIDCCYGDDIKEVCLFFEIPKEFRKDFELFKLGRYSEFSDKYKDILITTYGKNQAIGYSETTGLPNVSMFDILYPTELKKKALAEVLGVKYELIKEVMDPPNPDCEIYKEIKEFKAVI